MKGAQIKNVLIIVLSITLGVLITLLVIKQKQEGSNTQENPIRQEKKEKKSIEKETEEIEHKEKPKKQAPERSQTETLTEEELNDAYFVFLDAWNRKDYAVQANMIASDFVYQDDVTTQNRSAYLENKRKRFGDYNWLSVIATDEKIIFNGGSGSVTYYQHYDSPSYESWGYNTLHFRKVNSKVELYKEVFRPTKRVKK
jgi:hypothetical protein